MDRKSYSSQIFRLSALRGWSDLERAAKTELCDALIACSRSPEHARAIIDAIISTEHYVPTPARMQEIAQSTPDPARRVSEPRASCIECRGTGFRHYWALATWELNSAGAPVGRALIEEIPRPAHISPEVWDVSGPREWKCGPGQHVYEMVSQCHCTRS